MFVAIGLAVTAVMMVEIIWWYYLHAYRTAFPLPIGDLRMCTTLCYLVETDRIHSSSCYHTIPHSRMDI